MKHFSFLLCLLLSFSSCPILFSQNQLVGVSSFGGEFAQGALFNVDVSSKTLSIRHTFPTANPGENPSGTLLFASNQLLYGMTENGGKYDQGVLFSVDTLGNNYQVLVNFNDSLGGYPFGSLIQGADGLLYGMTRLGGANNDGLIFSLDPSNNDYQVLHTFNGNNGSAPAGDLLQSSDGLLYGMTRTGGDPANNSSGTLFSYDPANGTFVSLLSLSDSLGKSPYGSLIEASDGKLYGMTFRGGADQSGVLFSYDRSAATYSILHNFDSDSTGKWGRGNLVEWNGKLYGMTQQDGLGDDGCIFSYDMSSGNVSVEFSFNAVSGSRPYGSLTMFNGLLYGMTRDDATLFSYDPQSGSLLVQHLFDPDGNQPRGSLSFVNGKAYGLTFNGGANQKGEAFVYNPSNDQFSNLLAFSPAIEGGIPNGNLIKASSGLYYGLTENGGLFGKGVLFRFDPQLNQYQKLHDFEMTNRLGQTGVFEAQNGKLYGVLAGSFEEDGDQKGMLFEYDPSLDSFRVCKILLTTDVADGATFNSIPLEVAPEKLIGTTGFGGINNGGVIYEYDCAKQTYTVRHRFEVSTGHRPQGALIQAQNGKLYGLAIGGNGNPSTVLYAYNLVDSSYQMVFEFPDSISLFPGGQLMEFDSLDFYGVYSSNSNPSTDSRIFRYNVQDSAFSEVFPFTSSTGYRPSSHLIAGPDSVLFGATRTGGGIYAFDLKNSAFDLLLDFEANNLSSPGFQMILEAIPNAIGEKEDRIQVLLGPNPASDVLHLYMDIKTPAEIHSAIWDLSGRLVWEGTFLPSQTSHIHSIPISHFASGLYIFQATIEGKQKSLKFWKE